MPTAILTDSEKMETDQPRSTELKTNKPVAEVVKFGENIEAIQSDLKLAKRHSFAVASAFDAINERHPKVVLDHLQVCQHKLFLLIDFFICGLAVYLGH